MSEPTRQNVHPFIPRSEADNQSPETLEHRSTRPLRFKPRSRKRVSSGAELLAVMNDLQNVGSGQAQQSGLQSVRSQILNSASVSGTWQLTASQQKAVDVQCEDAYICYNQEFTAHTSIIMDYSVPAIRRLVCELCGIDKPLNRLIQKKTDIYINALNSAGVSSADEIESIYWRVVSVEISNHFASLVPWCQRWTVHLSEADRLVLLKQLIDLRDDLKLHSLRRLRGVAWQAVASFSQIPQSPADSQTKATPDEKVLNFCKSNGINLTSFAGKARISERTLRKFRKLPHGARESTIDGIASAIGISKEELLK